MVESSAGINIQRCTSCMRTNDFVGRRKDNRVIIPGTELLSRIEVFMIRKLRDDVCGIKMENKHTFSLLNLTLDKLAEGRTRCFDSYCEAGWMRLAIGSLAAVMCFWIALSDLPEK